MLEKNKLIIRILLLTCVVFAIFSSCHLVNASEGDSLIANIENNIKSFENAAKEYDNGINTDEITKPFIALGQVLTMIGAGVLVAVTTYMGIRYLTEGPEAQAKLKTQLFGLIVSGLVIFGAYFIWKLVIYVVSAF